MGLLGRKERIQELEEELAALRAKASEMAQEAKGLRVGAERADRRRREAVAARQEADERLHRLEDRIHQLEGDRERPQEASEGRHVRREQLSGRRLEDVLERLRSFRAPRAGALTATVQDEVPDAVGAVLLDRAALVRSAAPCLVLADDAGIVSVVLRPPLLPELPSTREEQFVLEPEWFIPSGRFVLALVRSDLFAAGVYEGETQMAFKGANPPVRRRHSKGGFSQGRYEQHRKDHVSDHIRRCAQMLQELSPEDTPLYLVGQREAVQALAAEVAADRTAAVDATGSPRQALDEAFRSFWTTEMRVL